MSNAPDDFDETEPEAEQPKRNFRRELEERATAAEQKAAALERENAIFKAGISGLSERQMRSLTREIEGDPTPESVKAAAAELWPERFGTNASKDDVPADERTQLDQVTAATTGAQSTGADPFAVLDGIDNEADFWKQAEANGLTTS